MATPRRLILGRGAPTTTVVTRHCLHHAHRNGQDRRADDIQGGGRHRLIMTNHRKLQLTTLGFALSVALPACEDIGPMPGESNTGTTTSGSKNSTTNSNAPGTTGGADADGSGAGTTNSTGAGTTTTSSSGGSPGPESNPTGPEKGEDSTDGGDDPSDTTDNTGSTEGEKDTGDTGDSDGPGDADGKDPFLWLEEVESKASLDWVTAQNKQTVPKLEAVAGFAAVKDGILKMANSKDRIPGVSKIGSKYLYNFWRDAQHVRGIWRRTTLKSFRSKNTEWTTVLDLDALAKAEGENWVWGGTRCLQPSGTRCMISLSRGGKDADVMREFDTVKMAFVDGGFTIPEAKSLVTWIGKNELLVGTDFGKGSLAKSGYPRTVRRWIRGNKLEDAKEIYRVKETDQSASSYRDVSQNVSRTLLIRAKSFYDVEYYRLNGDDTKLRYRIPGSATLGFWGPWMIVQLKEDWKIKDTLWKQGSLLIIDEVAFLSGERNFEVVYEPGPKKSLVSYTATKDYLLLTESNDVKARLYEWRYAKRTRGWEKREVMLPGQGGLQVSPYDSDTSNRYFLTYQDYLTPQTLFLGFGGKDNRKVLREMPGFFDASNLEVAQHFATSKDGTKVPYFQVSRKGMPLNGENPTILYGYGGFEISLNPRYQAGPGKGWLERGGVYVVANIRGGGEYGPAWHRAALKENRQRAFDDFAAVGEDLITRKVTSAKRLGIRGGSNGGLLTGVSMVQRPDLWNAVVSSVPLLDMKRFHLLLAGASWVGEYGNPDDPKEWDYISKYSPYQNVEKGVKYPPVFFTTSTKDDRVHPGHARKMMARMLEQGHEDLYYYENTEGGHGGAANNEQVAFREALVYSFFADKLGLNP